MKNISKLIISLLIPQLVGGIGSIFTVRSVGDWYLTLEKPALNPPSWIFGPVWTGLFFLMGYSLYLIWIKDAPNKKPAYWIFGAQLFLNALWSALFFGLKNPGLAFLEIWIMWIMIAINIYIFYRFSRLAAWLLAPYLLWVSFAMYLNYSIWRLN